MSPSQIRLPADDPKSNALIAENLRVCAWNRILSRKLLNRLGAARGPSIAVIPDWVDLGHLSSYEQGSVPPNRLPYEKGESPVDELVDFAERYLGTSSDSIIVCDNTQTAMKSLEIWTWTAPPRYAKFQNSDVYYLLTSATATRDTIGAALTDSLWQWGIAVCSACSQMPAGDTVEEDFVDEIVANSVHLLMPAFDGDGYLIWTPELTP